MPEWLELSLRRPRASQSRMAVRAEMTGVMFDELITQMNYWSATL
jgi:hypothetical protein